MIRLEELKKALIELGVDPKLAEMPAVMERVSKLLGDCRDADEIKEQLVVEDQTFTIDENPGEEKRRMMRFKLIEGGAYIEIHMGYDMVDDYSVCIKVDDNGMDKEVVSYSMDGDSHVRIAREDGIVNYGPYSVAYGGKERKFEDNGDACLAYGLENRQIKRSYDKNKEYYTRNYPGTKEFYAVLESTRTDGDER